jgi:protein-S-isoprenylcysteine O-methyltransferase Ste14
MLLYVPVIALSIRNEEQVLERDLKGYKEYKLQVRYKVIPYIW